MRNFYFPANLTELTACLKEKDNNTFIVAGGTDLAIHINENKKINFDLIDVSSIPELKKISETTDEIIISSAVTATEITKNELCKKFLADLVDACYSLGSEQIRNRATIGGNLANASQSADMLPVLFAHDALCEIINENNETKTVAIREFVIGINKTNLGEKEAIINIKFKKSNTLCGFSKVGARKTVTISKLSCCIMFNLEKDIIKNPTIYLGSVATKPLQATIIEKAINSRNINDNFISEIKEDIRQEILRAIPNRSSKDYKKEAAIGVVEDVLNLIKGRL